MTMWFNRTVRIVGPCLLVWAGATAAAGQDPLPFLGDYHIRTFTVADGLPASDVRAIVQGPDGFIYVGGGRGLARYDGYRFERVPLPGFASRAIDWFHVDGAGRLWLWSRGNDLGYLVGDRLRVLPPAPGWIYGISESGSGDLWLGTDRGLANVDPESTEPYILFTRAHGLPGDTAYGMAQLPGGERLAITRRGIARFSGTPTAVSEGRFVEVLGPAALGARRVGYPFVTTSSGLLVNTDAGMVRLGGGQPVVLGAQRRDPGLPLKMLECPAAGAQIPRGFAYRFLFPDSLRRRLPRPYGPVLCARNGTRWIVGLEGSGMQERLVRERAGRVQVIDLESHLDFRSIRSLWEDHEGGIWVGTDRGLIQLSPRGVAALGRRHGLAEGFTTAILETTDDALWVGTWGGGLHRYEEGGLAARYTEADGLPDNRIRSLHEGPDGALWIGTGTGIAVLGRDQPSFRAWPGPHARDFAGAEGPNGGSALWVAAGDRLLVGVGRTDRGFTEYRPGYDWGGAVWAVHGARDGSLWVGGRGGLFRISDGVVERFGRRDGLRGDFVVAIHEEADGTLWLSTYESGLYRYRNGEFAAVTTRVGLHNDGVWRMLNDSRGGVWMSSDAGLFRVEHHRLHEVADAVEGGGPPADPLDPLVFTEAEGMPSRECNRASPGGWRLRDGRLLFNNLAGVVVVDPEDAITPPPPPRTVIRAVRTDGRLLASDTAGTPRLPAGARHVTLAYAALSFSTPDQNRYRYRLDGYDADWIDGGTEEHTSYTGLGPGRYTFRVAGATGPGDWGEAASYTFVIPPFFWQAWWFRLAAVAGVLGILAVAYRYRVHRLLEMERLRLRIASDLHDDVGSNLSSIALLSEMLRERSGTGALERRQLERISRAAGETIGALREIIWLVDPRHDNPADLVARMRATAGDMLNGIDVGFDVTQPLSRQRADPALIRQTFLIYKEALHNLVKHSGASRVEVSVALEGDALVMGIRDDGRGFSDADVEAGQGLESMRRRAHEIGGLLEIESRPGVGTRIRLRVRLT